LSFVTAKVNFERISHFVKILLVGLPITARTQPSTMITLF
jgi:hypothetical protein